MRLHECDVCENRYEYDAPTVDFDPHSRSFGGNLHYLDGDSVEWPLGEAYIDICPECCAVVADVLRERMR